MVNVQQSEISDDLFISDKGVDFNTVQVKSTDVVRCPY